MIDTRFQYVAPPGLRLGGTLTPTDMSSLTGPGYACTKNVWPSIINSSRL